MKVVRIEKDGKVLFEVIVPDELDVVVSSEPVLAKASRHSAQQAEHAPPISEPAPPRETASQPASTEPANPQPGPVPEPEKEPPVIGIDEIEQEPEEKKEGKDKARDILAEIMSLAG